MASYEQPWEAVGGGCHTQIYENAWSFPPSRSASYEFLIILGSHLLKLLLCLRMGLCIEVAMETYLTTRKLTNINENTDVMFPSLN
jgi:hypothetical protein